MTNLIISYDDCRKCTIYNNYFKELLLSIERNYTIISTLYFLIDLIIKNLPLYDLNKRLAIHKKQ